MLSSARLRCLQYPQQSAGVPPWRACCAHLHLAPIRYLRHLLQVNLKGDAAQLLEPGAVPAAAAAAPVPAAPAAPAAAAPAVVSAASGDWSEVQELALVKALKQVGKDAEDRWGQVRAGLVWGVRLVQGTCAACVWWLVAALHLLWQLAAALLSRAPPGCGHRAPCPPCPSNRQVSALVPGKTKAQCFKRFKELKDAHKAKKTG